MKLINEHKGSAVQISVEAVVFLTPCSEKGNDFYFVDYENVRLMTEPIVPLLRLGLHNILFFYRHRNINLRNKHIAKDCNTAFG